MLNSAFLYSFQSNKETENQMFKIGLGRIGCLLMASSEDFQSIYELYKKEGIPNGISIVNFFQQNGIVNSQFERWFKSRKKSKSSIHPIRIVDQDGLMTASQEEVENAPN